MKKLTKFDLGVIIAFVVIGLAGGGAYWWLSGILDLRLGGTKDSRQHLQ